jgi:outer membrane receptor protein involved in Fe transport
MKFKFVFALICTLILPALLFGAETGKITGKVVDKETGEGLPGANVLITGTSMGAITDVDGKYIMLNVPAGVYSIRASFVGFRTVTVTNVGVSGDLTTSTNFELPSQALDAGDITIIAERPLVNKSATNAVRIQRVEDFKNIPTRSVNSIISLQPGVVVKDGQIYIRGGRSEEIGYILEGASTRDVIGGSNLVTIIPEALEEFQVQAGGYNAEFGGANAGIIRSTLRSGTSDYRLTLQGETDNFANPGETFLGGTSSWGYSDYTATVSGPVPYTNNKIKFFVAGQNTYWADDDPRFWQGFEFNNADEIKNATTFPLVTTTYGVVYDQLKTLDNWTYENNSNTYNGAGTLVYDGSKVRVRLATNLSYTKRQNGAGVGSILNRDRTGFEEFSSGLYTGKITHIVNPRTYHELAFDYFDRRYKTYDKIFGDDYYQYADSVANAAAGYQYINWATANVTNTVDIYGFNFTDPGTPAGYSKSKRNYISAKYDFTTQYKNHEIKLGADAQRWTYRTFSAAPFGMFTNRLNNPDLYAGALAGDLADYGALNVSTGQNLIGYDMWGKEINENYNGIDGPKHPVYGSAYLQDKFEAKQLVINAGVRVDYIDNDDFSFADMANPAWDKTNHTLIADEVVQKDPGIYVSPRLGLAFPATNRTVFHVQYGKFVQAPRLDQIYTPMRYLDALFTGGNYFTTPPGFGLDPMITTQYEVGFNQQFADAASFDITVFYKDIQDWITAGRIQGGPNDIIAYYNILENGDFATTKGVELSLTLRRTNRVAAQVNYTYSSALGTGSVWGSSLAGTEQGVATPSIISPLDFNRPHVGSINVDYRFGKNDGGMILSQLGMNLLFQFQSGHPYTLREGAFGQQDASTGGEISDTRNRNPLESVNSSMTPWNYTLDLRLDKTVDLGPVAANFYIYAMNLTNKQNVANVYMRTGNAYDDGFKADSQTSASIAAANGGNLFWTMYDAINLAGNGTNSQSGRLLGTPRQVRAGIRLEF